jgi:hypothetical protein
VGVAVEEVVGLVGGLVDCFFEKVRSFLCGVCFVFFSSGCELRKSGGGRKPLEKRKSEKQLLPLPPRLLTHSLSR